MLQETENKAGLRFSANTLRFNASNTALQFSVKPKKTKHSNGIIKFLSKPFIIVPVVLTNSE